MFIRILHMFEFGTVGEGFIPSRNVPELLIISGGRKARPYATGGFPDGNWYSRAEVSGQFGQHLNRIVWGDRPVATTSRNQFVISAHAY